MISFFSLHNRLAAQGAPQRPQKKEKVEKTHIDPLLRNLSGRLTLDETTQKALERAKKPGVLVGEKEEANKIFRIEIVGAKKVEFDAVILRMDSKIGEEYSPTTIASDISEISKMGLFKNVQVFKAEAQKSKAVFLKYVLTEIPTIFQFRIEGNRAISEEEIIEKGLSGLEKYQVANDARLQSSAEKIREYYVSKGFFLAEVTYELEETSKKEIEERDAEDAIDESGNKKLTFVDTTKVLAPDFVNVIFKVIENDKVVINRISILGNEKLSDHEIKTYLRSREEHLMSLLTDWGNFSEEYVALDKLILQKLLHDNGFLKGQVLEPLVQISSDKKQIFIQHSIVEGDQYRLGEVNIYGDFIENSEDIYHLKKEEYPDEAVFLQSKLKKQVTLQKDAVFNKSQIAQDVIAISEKYRNKGYPYTNVLPIPEFRDDEKIIDLNIQITSGPKVYIERIDIEGNEKTKDEVIRRELKIFEGDLYSSTLLRVSEQNVNRLGYFETVEFSELPGSNQEKIILKIKVKEQSTGNIQVGAGYGTGGEGIVFRGQISNQNLFGRGQTLSASVNWSNFRKIFDVSFIEPYLTYVFDNPLTFAFTAYNRDIFMGEFTRRSWGGDITLGYPIGGPFGHFSRKWQRNASFESMPYVLDFDALWFYLTYTAERVEIHDLSAQVRRFDLFHGVPRYTTSLRPTIRLDQRDNRMFPSRGYYFEFRAEFANSYFGSGGLAALETKATKNNTATSLDSGRKFLKPQPQSNNYARYVTNFRIYHNLDSWFFLKGFVFKSNIELGLLNTFGQPLVFENFSVGGLNTIRGYTYRSISPTERASALFPFDPRKDLRVGGNKQLFGSFELEFPIFKSLKVGGVIFFDYGNAYSYKDNLFYIGGKSAQAERVKPSDPLGLYNALGLYSSVGFGIRWLSPLGYLRFEWGFPLNRRPPGSPGMPQGDDVTMFEFNIGPSF